LSIVERRPGALLLRLEPILPGVLLEGAWRLRCCPRNTKPVVEFFDLFECHLSITLAFFSFHRHLQNQTIHTFYTPSIAPALHYMVRLRWKELRILTESVRDLGYLVVELERNEGPAVGRNAGMAVSHGGIIAFLDDTVRVCPGWLAAVVQAIATGADYVCGPVKLSPVGPDSVVGETTEARVTT
jgi:glycosyltransferase involved in cell wall biosynthesis